MRQSRLPFFLLLLSLLLLAPAAAQDDTTEYPTLEALHQAHIPQRDRLLLAEQLLGVTDVEPPPTSAPPRELGHRETFSVANTAANTSFNIEAVLRAVGEHIYVYVEEGVALNTPDLQALVEGFDQRVYPNLRALWGSEDIPGIDGDPRVYALFAYNLGGGTAAYVSGDHSYPDEAVPVSNEHEMFFFNLDAIGTDFDPLVVESVVAHEFQHMIRNNLQANEETWMNEGFSTFTQLQFYELPMWEIASFLGSPATQLNHWAEDAYARVNNYGAAALFITYFYDRYGEDALRQLSADNATFGLDSFDNILTSMGEPGVDEFFADWVVANYLFDPTVVDGRYGYRRIPPDTISVQPRETITAFPWEVTTAVYQYGSDYYILEDLGEVTDLKIAIDAPDTVGLVPAEAYSGEMMWYSNRADVSSTTLTQTFDLTGVDSAALEYQLWFEIEEFWDYGYVMVSTDDGATWTALETDATTTENPQGTAYGPGYTSASGGGTLGEWISQRVSLDEYAGQEIMLRFQMITDDAVTRPGMLIDDVRIEEIGYFSDFESDDGGWQAEGWVRIDNVLPQQVWVQAVQQTANDAFVTRWLGPTPETWLLELEPGVERVAVIVSPFAPFTTVPMPYTLKIDAQ